MLHDNEKHLDDGDRLDELENQFELVAATPFDKRPDKVAKASALAMLSLAIDSVREVIDYKERAEENEASTLRVNSEN